MSQSLNALAPEFMNKNEYTSPRHYMEKEVNHLSPEDYKRWCNMRAEKERCLKRAADCVECEKPCEDPCADPCKEESFGFGWLGVLILWFIIFTVIFWLIFFSLQPSWTLNQDGSVNTGKVLLAAIIAAIILVIIIWLIKSCVDYSR